MLIDINKIMYQRKSTERHSAVSKKFIVLVIGTYGVSSTAIREISPLLRELKDDDIVWKCPHDLTQYIERPANHTDKRKSV